MRALGIGLGVAGAMIALALFGCASEATGPDARCDEPEGPCASVPDAGASDAAFGGESDGGPFARDAAAGVDGGTDPAPPTEDREGFTDASECFNGLDDDDYESADCSNTYCMARPVCCVGVASDACCGVESPRGGFTTAIACGSGAIDACSSAMAEGVPFGSPLPTLYEGALVPNGDITRDSGFVLAEQVAPSTAVVHLRADLAAPNGCTDCIDGVAVGLARNAAGDPRIQPVVAVQVSGSRGEAMLVAGTSVLWRSALPDDATHRYDLTTYPDGRVVLVADFVAERVERTLAMPAGALDVVVYGRTTNRGASDTAPARLVSLTVASSACDMPAALQRGTSYALAETVGAPFVVGRAHAPSVGQPALGTAADARMAFAANGAIWLAHPDGSGGWEVPAGATASLDPNELLTVSFDEPSLVALEDRWLLFVTVRDATGARRVQRVRGATGFGEVFEPTMLEDVIALPIADTGSGEIVQLDGASAFRSGSELVLAARALDAAGRSSIVLLRGTAGADGAFSGAFGLDDAICGTGCESVDEESGLGTAERIHEQRDGVADAFDRDEVGAPAIVRSGEVYRLYYAGRRGTRWSIGMLVSFDLVFFRSASAGAALLTGSGAGADALGVTDPEPWLDDGQLVLFHSGTDGAQTHVLAAAQPLR